MLIVVQLNPHIHNNCALCDKSTKFGTHVDDHIKKTNGYWAIADFGPDGCGSQFPKWPPTVAYFTYIFHDG